VAYFFVKITTTMEFFMSEIGLLDHVFPTTTGEINLALLDAAWLIIYFYPKDSTPGCMYYTSCWFFLSKRPV